MSVDEPDREPVAGKTDQMHDGGNHFPRGVAGFCSFRFESDHYDRLFAQRLQNFLENLKDEALTGNELFSVDRSANPSPSPEEGTQRYKALPNETLTGSEDGSLQNAMSCFNCSGEHPIIECPLPLDKKQIAANRRKLLAGKNQVSKERFFENKRCYGAVEVGKWSKSLLEALDVQSNELPEFVYRMRVLGYPPGWLEETRLSRSLKIFEETPAACEPRDDGEDIGNRCNDEDEGETDEDPSHDPNELIEIPGFNVPVGPTVIDDHPKFGLPGPDPSKFKSKAVQSFESYNQKRKLEKTETNVRPGENLASKTETPPPSMEPVTDSRSDPSARSSTGGSTPGTPMPGFTPQPMPEPQKWSRGIAEHIPYENLPGSTGTFDKLRGVIHRIRGGELGAVDS